MWCTRWMVRRQRPAKKLQDSECMYLYGVRSLHPLTVSMMEQHTTWGIPAAEMEFQTHPVSFFTQHLMNTLVSLILFCEMIIFSIR